MGQLEEQICLRFQQRFQLLIHLSTGLDHDNVDPLEHQLDDFVVLLVDLAAFLLGISLHFQALGLRHLPVFLYFLGFGLPLRLLVQQLVEKVEVDGEYRVSRVDIPGPYKDACCLVEETEGVYSVRGLRPGAHQENREFLQDGGLNLLSVITMEAGQDPDHSIDGVTLDLFDGIAKLIDNHADQLGGQVRLATVRQDLRGDVQGCLLLELKLSMAHRLQNGEAKLA